MQQPDTERSSSTNDGGLSRRAALRLFVSSAGMLALAACGPAQSPANTPAPAAPQPTTAQPTAPAPPTGTAASATAAPTRAQAAAAPTPTTPAAAVQAAS